jgi:hypothetical protein
MVFHDTLYFISRNEDYFRNILVLKYTMFIFSIYRTRAPEYDFTLMKVMYRYTGLLYD